MIKVIFEIERIGPYHNSRLNNASEYKDLEIKVLQTNQFSKRYPWKEDLSRKYTVYNLEHNHFKNISKSQISKSINKLIKEFSPNVIFVSGWNQKFSLYLLWISYRKKIPLVLISDSRHKDHYRNMISENIKKILLKGFSSALVSGTESEEYLIRLGFNKFNIFRPLDVVDNNFFLNRNTSVKNFNNDYILCVARFIKKKNHITLIKAFEIYKKKKGKLKLLLIGDGPEKERIIEEKKKLIFSDEIHIESWKNKSELKEFYSNAKFFVLLSYSDQWGLVVNEAMASGLPCIVSKNCGCFLDLIKDKNTGWGVDPFDKEQVANMFLEADKIDNKELKKMQSNIYNVLENFSLNKFSIALKNSTINAMGNRYFSKISSLLAYFIFLFK